MNILLMHASSQKGQKIRRKQNTYLVGNEIVAHHRKRALCWHDKWKEEETPRHSTQVKYHHELNKVKLDEN